MSGLNWRTGTDFGMWMQATDKRMMRQERRPAVTNATQILGPGAGPFAVLLNDWNEEAALFTGVFYSVPGAVNGPNDDPILALPAGDYWWMGETFGVLDEDDYHYGFQRLTAYRVDPVEATGSWTMYARRFFPDNELVGYGAWEAL